MKRTMKFATIALFVGAIMVSCGSKERTLEDYQKEAAVFKSGLPESYVVLGECIDTLVQKVYYTNRVSPWEDANEFWQYNLDRVDNSRYPKKLLELIAQDTSDTFIKVYNLQTGDTSNIDFSKLDNLEGDKFDDFQLGVCFSHYANGKLFFSVPESRYGGSIYYINVYSDDVNYLVGNGVTNVRVENNKIVYHNEIVTNEDDAQCTADYNWASKDFTIDL